MSRLILGIDTGGTFTDFVILQEGRLKRWKVLSSPSDPSSAIIAGLKEILGNELKGHMEVVHGTTVGTNAFLERKGARTCLITTKGFEDVIFIGRQARPALYDLYAQKPRQIIPQDMVFGIEERLNAKGDIVKKLHKEEVERCVDFVEKSGARAVAVCLLHSYMNPENEERLEEALRALDVKVCISSKLVPEFREYERTTTTLINAYLGPVVGNYVRTLEKRLPSASILVQQSSGGCLPVSAIEDKAVTTLLSGPAGGVLAGMELGRSLGIKNILTFDMGGTSTDVSLCPGELSFTRDYKIEGYPINLPVIDVHTVGAGGGSIAWVDKGGLLRVGPQSAGADPGPVCYGKGAQITVTDANLFLGRLRPERFLAGRMMLHQELVEEKMAQLGLKIGLGPVETALGIIKLVNTNMVQALRQVSIERGYDPRDFHLVSFGGAAGLHALAVAEELGVNKILIPEMAGVFSAQGLASSDLVFEASRALFWQSSKDKEKIIENASIDLKKELLDQFPKHLRHEEIETEIFLDARYLGQSFELMIPFKNDWITIFHEKHKRLYGYHLPDRTVEITSVRIRIRIRRHTKEIFFQPPEKGPKSTTRIIDPSEISFDFSDMMFETGRKRVPVVERKEILKDMEIKGPLLIIDDFTTILILEKWRIRRIDGHLLAFRT